MRSRRIKVALLAASPIPYRAPLHRLIAADPRIDFTAIFASTGGIRPVDAGYGKPIAWDVDLLGGYRSIFLNRSHINPIDGHFLSFRDFDIINQLRDNRCDVLWVWGYNYLTHQIAIRVQQLLHRPIIFHEEQHLLDRRPMWRTGIKRLALPQMLRGGKALYIGTQNYRWFRHYGLTDDDLYFAPYAVDNPRLRAAAESLRPKRSQLRRSFGIDDDAGPVILSVARLIPKKQPLMLLKAFSLLRKRKRCALLIVGSGELEGALRQEVDRHGIPDVNFAGFLNQTQIPRAYACADIFVLPSKSRETWGVSVNEAMNFGLPVVVSDKVGCAVDLVREGENGFVVPFRSPHALADRLGRLVESEDMRGDFGEASLARVNGWTYEVAAAGVLNAIADAVGSERWTPPIASVASGSPT